MLFRSRIHFKKQRIVFECIDTGPHVSTKPKQVQEYFDSLPKSSGMTAMLAIVRSMKGKCGILPGLTSMKEPSTIFWFSSNKNGRKTTMKSKTCTLDRNALQTFHSASQSRERLDAMTTKIKNTAFTTCP